MTDKEKNNEDLPIREAYGRRYLQNLKERITFRLPEHVHRALMLKAIEENRTLSNYILNVLSNHVQDTESEEED